MERFTRKIDTIQRRKRARTCELIYGCYYYIMHSVTADQQIRSRMTKSSNDTDHRTTCVKERVILKVRADLGCAFKINAKAYFTMLYVYVYPV